MVTMENAEEVMQILERFTRLKQKEIPKELDEYLGYVAKTGDTVFKWSSLKYLFREKLLNVIKQFHDATPRIDEIPQYPNVDPFNYESMKSTLLERLELFNAAPFTVQRLCELLIDPRKQYSRIDKFMRALEKNILVVSTVEPGRKRTESENGDSLDSVVNGDILLDVNVDIDMEADSLLNMESQAQNNTENTENDAATAATVNENGGDNTSIAFSLSSQEDAVESSDKANTSNEKEFAVKTMATHLADDDILPHPKKVKLDLIAQAQNEEQEDDEEEEQYREMKSDALDKKDSPVKQKQETAKEINEKSADNISDEQTKKNDLENGQDRQEEPQKADREKPHNFEEVKEASDDENVKVNVDTGVVATIPVIATTIAEINEKGKPTAAMTRMTTTVTSVDNENIEINSVNEETEQSIRQHQVVQQKQGKVNNEQSTNVDAINKIQAAEDEEPRTEEKALLVVEEEKREEEKQLKNLPQNKTSDCSDSTKTPTSEPQQIIASAKGEKGESTAAETVVEKRELEKCEKEQNNIKITDDDKNGDKIAQETLKKVEEQINEQNDENNEEKTKETQQQSGEDNAKVERHERGENVLREDEELLELQLLSNKTEELVEVIENNQVETIHEDLEENSAETEDKLENVIDEKEESKNITLDKKKADNYKIDTDSAAINLPKEVNVNLEKCSNEEEKSERKSLVEIVEHQVQQKEPVEIIESEKYEQEHKEVENAECEIDTAAALQSTTAESSTVATAKELEILNEIALQTANTASRLNNETKICETLGMATEIPTTVTTDNFSQQQILGGDVVVAAEPSISSDSIIILPTAIEQTPAPTSVSVLTNISTQGEQPMIQDVTIEEEAPPTVEEVVMAEPPSQPLSSSQQLIASITSVTSAPAIMDVESSCMEVDDTSQEAMDQ